MLSLLYKIYQIIIGLPVLHHRTAGAAIHHHLHGIGGGYRYHHRQRPLLGVLSWKMVGKDHCKDFIVTY